LSNRKGNAKQVQKIIDIEAIYKGVIRGIISVLNKPRQESKHWPKV
jgi:hypothetical protein